MDDSLDWVPPWLGRKKKKEKKRKKKKDTVEAAPLPEIRFTRDQRVGS